MGCTCAWHTSTSFVCRGVGDVVSHRYEESWRAGLRPGLKVGAVRVIIRASALSARGPALASAQLLLALRANMAAGPDPPSPLSVEPTGARLDVRAAATFSRNSLCCHSLGQGCPLDRVSEAFSYRLSSLSPEMKTNPNTEVRGLNPLLLHY